MTKKSQIGDYSPDEESRQKAIAFWRKKDRIDLIAELDDQIEQFQAHHRAHGNKMLCWPSAFTTWYCNAERFTRGQRQRQQRTEPRSFQSHSDRPTQRKAFKASDQDTSNVSPNLKSMAEVLAGYKRG